MRTTGFVLLAALLCAAPARAQSDDHKWTKVLIGAGALAIGTAVAAKSSESTTIKSNVGMSETSSFSKSQLITGLAIAGTGGIILWDGLRNHYPQGASTAVGLAVAKQAGGLFVRRTW